MATQNTVLYRYYVPVPFTKKALLVTTGEMTAAALRWLLSAYRAMLPVKVVVAHMEERLVDASEGGHWSSLEVQVGGCVGQ